jgi:hypothetical protein
VHFAQGDLDRPPGGRCPGSMEQTNHLAIKAARDAAGKLSTCWTSTRERATARRGCRYGADQPRRLSADDFSLLTVIVADPLALAKGFPCTQGSEVSSQ